MEAKHIFRATSQSGHDKWGSTAFCDTRHPDLLASLLNFIGHRGSVSQANPLVKVVIKDGPHGYRVVARRNALLRSGSLTTALSATSAVWYAPTQWPGVLWDAAVAGPLWGSNTYGSNAGGCVFEGALGPFPPNNKGLPNNPNNKLCFRKSQIREYYF